MKPIISSGFAYGSETPELRAFYDRWYTQGGHNGRDHCGIVKRARDLPEWRNYQELQLWGRIQWSQQQQRAATLAASMAAEQKAIRVAEKPKARVIPLKFR
jgi:hypothetical protein